MNAAAAQSQAAVQTQAETFGRSLFAAQVNDANLSNTQFVTNLYEAFLQRGPDAGGLGWWSGQATVGTGRQNVLGAFAGCTAFRDLSGTLYREANWLVSDHLGTPRMIANKSGSLASMKRHDYLPFGEELGANISGRTPTQGYSGDTIRQKFTSKERDNETGLDYFLARYFASTQGRFTSPDPFSITLLRQNSHNDDKAEKAFLQFINDPRRWNRLAYAVNSPLVFTDKTGLDIMVIENHATQGNPAGHTAIAITGKGLWSSGNAGREENSTEFNDIVRGGVKDYILRELPKRDTTVYIIKTTKEQDNAAAATLDATAGSGKPLTYAGILTDNCSTRSNEALDAAGVESGSLNPSLPGSAGLRTVTDPAVRVLTEVIDIPQNSNLTKGDLDAIKQFEPTTQIPKPRDAGSTPSQRTPMRRRS